MHLFALALATPLFGFALHLDPALAAPSGVFAQLGTAVPATEGADASALVATGPEGGVPVTVRADGTTTTTMVTPSGTAIAPTDAAHTVEEPAPTEATTPPGPRNDVAAQLARRAKIARIHRAFGLATWASMTITEVFGFLQYWNLYGWFASQGNNPCVKGDQIGGSHVCIGQPVSHAVFAGLTTATYFTTFGLSYAMPDPTHLDRGDSVAARRLRTHKRLRWAHFSGMCSQILLGIIAANGAAFGLDRANHYSGLQALATVHMLTGLATYATLTWAGAIMIRRR